MPFDWVGQLLDFVIKDGYKIKYLRLNVAEREYWVKVPKSLRTELDPVIGPGSYLAVKGWASRCAKTGKLKLKAESIQLADKTGLSEQTFAPATLDRPVRGLKKKSAKILVCTKSSCRKRGADAVCATLRETLRARGLAQCVEIKTTGCLKACKHGPTTVVMPGKVRYKSVTPPQAEALVAKHFGTGEVS
ncbi:MAG: (2Fe-2S) ferredoxin domain-containing protein [Cyanobacteria bacterium J06641_5]